MRRFFRLIGRESPVEEEIEAEISFHLDAVSDALIARGMSPEAARAESARRFGDLERARRALARIDRERRAKERRVNRLEELRQDIAYALRGFRRQPGFAAVIVLMMGLGTGATATMFGLVDRLLLKPPAQVADPDRLSRFELTESEQNFGSWTNESVAWKTYTDQRDNARYYAGIAAYFTAAGMPLGRGEGASKARVTLATASYFPLLGVRPALGRFFTPEEDQPGAGVPVAILSWRYWQRAYAGSPAAIGQQIFLGSQSYAVVGIAPLGFNGVDLSAVDLWVPFHAGAPDVVGKSGEWRETYGWQWLKILARLKPGVTRAQASDEAVRVQRAAVAGVPNVDHSATAALVSLQGFERAAVPHQREKVALWLASVALVVLLIVCANVANLLLARAARRRREIAVRLAIGVGRGRLVRQLLVESLLLALGGAAVALLVVKWGGEALRATLVPDVTWVEGTLDWRVALVLGAGTLIAGLLTGLAPAAQALRPSLVSSLKVGMTDPLSHRSRLRAGLLALQAGFSLVLLVGAGLFVRSLWRVTHADIGYRPGGVLVADLDLSLAGYDRTGRASFFDQALERARILPGVEAAALGTNSPFWTMNSKSIRLTDRDSTPRHPEGGPYYNGVTSDYFATVGMRLSRGRGFTAADRRGSAMVMVINQEMGRFFWPGQDPLGKCVKLGGDSLPCSTVIGVVADARVDAIVEKPRAMYYVPLEQSVQLGMNGDRILFVRARGEAGPLIAPLRTMLQGQAPNLPFANVRTFQSQIDPEIQPWRLGAVMFGVFGVLALLVAALGLYSVMSYTVAQRTHEFGVRTALGASGGRILATVVGGGIRVVGAGMLAGLLVCLIGGRFLAPLLYRTSARDPLVYALVGGTLALASVLALVIPARRATGVDPLEALRAD